MKTTLAAIDLGASNGRIMAARLWDGVRLETQETHRFEHSASLRDGRLSWDWQLIQTEIRRGLAKLTPTDSLSCCSWAQDFGLLDINGKLLGAPVSYLDRRTDGMPQSFRSLISPTDLTRRAGVAAANITTLCQLRSLVQQEPKLLAEARQLLHIADLVHFDLCGIPATDWTLASASQMCNRASGTWDLELLQLLELPAEILPCLKPAPAVLGNISTAGAPASGWSGVPVVLAAGHDTISAFHVLPKEETDTLFISCGTWIMLGLSLPEAFIPGIETQGTLLGLVDGGWGLWRGMLGLWMIQQCCRIWNKKGINCSYSDLAVAAQASSCQSCLDLSDPALTVSTDLPATVQNLCRAAGQTVPDSPGDIARVIYRSLALMCGDNIRALETAAGISLRRLRVVGGGSRNEWFCQLLADAAGLPVDAGPYEASAAGNLLLQLQALGVLENETRLDDARRASFELKTFNPAN